MPKAIDPQDIVKKVFGLLTVTEYVGVKQSGRNRVHMYKCDCDCGATDIIVSRPCLLKGDTRSCGCLHKRAGEAVTEDLTHRQFGRWYVLHKASRRVSESGTTRRTMWTCQCECGTIRDVGARALKTHMSQSCGCLQKERVSEALLDDLTNKEFGFLQVMYRNGEWRPKNGNKVGIKPIWHCKCKCGVECDVLGESLKNGDVTSCGCKKSSKYELYVEEYFEEHGYLKDVDFFREKTYSGLVGLGNGALRFDFLFCPVGKEPVLIECQGEQHVRVTEWYGGQDYLDRLQVHDQLKREFAKHSGIKLLEIPHTLVSKEAISRYLEKNDVN